MFSDKDFRVSVTMSPKSGHDNVDVDDEDGEGEGETKTIQIVKNSRKGEKVIREMRSFHIQRN